MHNFDTLAPTWDTPERAERARGVAAEIARRLPLDRSQTALEYGAGTGALSLALADQVGSILVTDASAGMIEMAERRIAEAGVAGLTARRLDLLTDPIPPDRVDLIFTLMALHHVSDVPAVLAAFHVLLRPQGHLAVIDLEPDDGAFHGHHEHGHEHEHEHDEDAPRGLDPLVLTEQLKQAGFTDVVVESIWTVTREVDGQPREFGLFLATALRP
ncbi:MAG: class I SAM-dependent methyltransferase [Micropruina sp.]|nr:class I SAM-dependent methyltransferase [Micropruina sp.]